jgi:para-nitrobenzyl esterase
MRNGLTLASEAEIMAHIKKTYGDKADAYLSAVKKAYPTVNMPSDLIDADFTFRPGSVAQANKKSSVKGGANTYMYLFTWQSPYMNGKYKAMHCIELPFVFNNIDRCEEMTGGGFEAHILADKVSKAWVQFAKTGNPNHSGLPHWPSYNESNGNTMIFDNHCEIRQHHDKELLELMSLN